MKDTTYSVKQCLELAACTGCQACADVCPAVQASGDAELSALYRMKGLKKILTSRGGKGILSRLLGREELTPEEWKHFSETVFKCTLCGKCEEVCPVGIHLKDLWVDLRKDLVTSEHYPKKIDLIKGNLESSHNVFAEDQEERADWTEDLDDEPEDKLVKDKAEVVYFTGCTAAYFPVAQKIPLALADILTRADVDFTLLGEDEWCCGFPLMGAGLPELAKGFEDHNLEAVKAKGADTVVFACPSCYEQWKEHYPYKKYGFKLYHATQFLRDLIRQGKIPMKKLDVTVTYHDPCDLGRGAREFDAPREIIKAIPGVKFVELPQNRDQCACCGGGGNLEMIDAQLSTDIAKSKMDEVQSTGADIVVTSCQQCVRTMTTYAKRNKVPVQVMDITMLVKKALAG